MLNRLASSELKHRRFLGFERCTSIGSGLFPFLDGGFAQMFGRIVSIIEKTLKNTNLEASNERDLSSGPFG